MRKARVRLSMVIDMDDVAGPNIVRALIIRGMVTGVRVKPRHFYNELVASQQSRLPVVVHSPVVIHKPKIVRIIEHKVNQEVGLDGGGG